LAAIRIVDSSLLIEADHRKVLGALEAHLRLDPGAIAPPRVYEETVTEPKSLGYFAQSASRIERLYSDGAIAIEKPDYSDPQVSNVVDRVRECIAKKAGKPVHMVERGDLQIVALAAAHAKKGDAVELVFRDKALKDCLELVLSKQGISGVGISDSSELVGRLRSRRR
jgi:hypothetical protein